MINYRHSDFGLLTMCGILQLIEMLKEKAGSMQVAVDQRSMMSQQCQERQLEAEVVREKLGKSRYC
jgi:hypothetical protein